MAGDGLEIRFDAPSPPPVDFRRTYFLRVTGWAKEGSFHNRTGGSIEPLPFRGMDRYPPASANRRDDEEYRSYRASYQTRHVRRRAL